MAESEHNPNASSEATLAARSWFLPHRVAAAFPGKANGALRKARFEWLRTLPEQQKLRRANLFAVRGDAILPRNSASPGETLASFLQVHESSSLGAIPVEAKALSGEQRERYLRERRVRRIDVDFQARCTHGKTTAAYRDALHAAHGEEIASLLGGFRWGEILRIREGRVDGRTGNGRAKQPVDKRLIERYAQIVLSPNFKKSQYAEAWRHARDLAEELGVSMPSRKVMRRAFEDAFPPIARARAKGARSFEAQHLPKIHREYSDVAPLEVVCLDGHVLDLRCQAPDAPKSGHAVRPVLTAVLDVRTRMFVGTDIDTSEHADGILRGLRDMHLKFGCAHSYYVDNGRAYKAAVGVARRVKRAIFRDERIASLAAETGASVTHALPYQGWSKMVERHFRHVCDSFARYFVSYWGNRPDARPEGVEKLPVWQLPTIEEVREAFASWLTAHHAEPQHGDGMYGLSPATAMEQFSSEVRRIDADVLAFLCTRSIGTRKFGRDGVRVNGVLYGQWDCLENPGILALQGETLEVRTVPSDASFVWVREPRNGRIEKLYNRRLNGATQADVRTANRTRSAAKRAARKYFESREVLLGDETREVMRAKAERAKARRAQEAASLPQPQKPDVTIVRPDLQEAVAEQASREQRRKTREAAQGRGKRQAQQDAALSTPAQRRRACLERLAQKGREDAERERLAAGERRRKVGERRRKAGWYLLAERYLEEKAIEEREELERAASLDQGQQLLSEFYGGGTEEEAEELGALPAMDAGGDEDEGEILDTLAGLDSDQDGGEARAAS